LLKDAEPEAVTPQQEDKENTPQTGEGKAEGADAGEENAANLDEAELIGKKKKKKKGTVVFDDEQNEVIEVSIYLFHLNYNQCDHQIYKLWKTIAILIQLRLSFWPSRNSSFFQFS
jgi:hypothetical protein